MTRGAPPCDEAGSTAGVLVNDDPGVPVTVAAPLVLYPRISVLSTSVARTSMSPETRSITTP